MMGKSVQVLKNSSDSKLELDSEVLRELLISDDNIRNRHVCVVSVAGAFRKGKSFLLSFFLRYLYSKYVRHDVSDWMADKDKPLKGFPWRSGSQRHTIGIHIWSDIFLHDYPDGRKIAIILMDTQGAFDHQSSVSDCSIVFALSTLLSSVQIYNLSQQIQENDLQNLQLFTEYGKMLLDDATEKPFQRLLFLIRDWQFLDFDYGADGGKSYLDTVLKPPNVQKGDLMPVRNYIKSCFEEIDCFLMPYPGKNVTTGKHFNGCLKDIDSDFNNNLHNLVSMLLDPSELKVKNINGKPLTSIEFVDYFNSYVSNFSGEKLPEPKSIILANIEACYQKIIRDCECLYEEQMEINPLDNRSFLCEKDLKKNHCTAEEKAFEKFDSLPKWGSEDSKQKFAELLKKNIEKRFTYYQEFNELSAKDVRLAAEGNANTYYRQKMEAVLAKEPFMHPSSLQAEHLVTQQHVLAEYQTKIKGLREERIQEHVKALSLDIDQLLTNFEARNKNKGEMFREKVLTEAKISYDDQMENICTGVELLFSEAELKSKHSQVLSRVLDQVGSKLKIGGEEFVQIGQAQLKRDSEELLKKYIHRNERNTERARLIAVEEAETYYNLKMSAQFLTTDQELNEYHNKIKLLTLEKFAKKLVKANEDYVKMHSVELEKDIEALFQGYKSLNKVALQSLIDGKLYYKEQMDKIFSSTSSFLSLNNLEDEHENISEDVFNKFPGNLKDMNTELMSNLQKSLRHEIKRSFSNYKSKNENNAKRIRDEASSAALKTYKTNMESVCGGENEFYNTEALYRQNEEYQENALSELSNAISKGADDFISASKSSLRDNIQRHYEILRIRTERNFEIICSNVKSSCLTNYDEKMETKLSNILMMSRKDLNTYHENTKEAVLTEFRKKFEMVHKDVLLRHQNDLNIILEISYKKYEERFINNETMIHLIRCVLGVGAAALTTFARSPNYKGAVTGLAVGITTFTTLYSGNSNQKQISNH